MITWQLVVALWASFCLGFLCGAVWAGREDR